MNAHYRMLLVAAVLMTLVTAFAGASVFSEGSDAADPSDVQLPESLSVYYIPESTYDVVEFGERSVHVQYVAGDYYPSFHLFGCETFTLDIYYTDILVPQEDFSSYFDEPFGTSELMTSDNYEYTFDEESNHLHLSVFDFSEKGQYMISFGSYQTGGQSTISIYWSPPLTFDATFDVQKGVMTEISEEHVTSFFSSLTPIIQSHFEPIFEGFEIFLDSFSMMPVSGQEPSPVYKVLSTLDPGTYVVPFESVPRNTLVAAFDSFGTLNITDSSAASEVPEDPDESDDPAIEEPVPDTDDSGVDDAGSDGPGLDFMILGGVLLLVVVCAVCIAASDRRRL